MLRFDLPQVWSNVVRWEAFITFTVCLLALLLSPWVMVLLVLQGAVRGFAGHMRCPSHLLWQKVFVATGHAGKKTDAGPKMFANKILFVASSVSLLLFLAGSPLWKVPCTLLIVFSFMEWALDFCAACWVYGAWYRRFPPSGS
ncbi:DUF4395 family protein [Piscinibacter sp. HJYY11]|uniref:DUF4395 family protein n=1 Tax=Piscinibacter sp. HJYY11 TaxID=2801333 RepID=UPI00191CB16A|nr:DUF4395 family protein [Piscinibacter sp. HJYY11]MBL0726583.1 DUF4395 domain-containing protein [Piscinibacter sp. HJYY11]